MDDLTCVRARQQRQTEGAALSLCASVSCLPLRPSPARACVVCHWPADASGPGVLPDRPHLCPPRLPVPSSFPRRLCFSPAARNSAGSESTNKHLVCCPSRQPCLRDRVPSPSLRLRQHRRPIPSSNPPLVHLINLPAGRPHPTALYAGTKKDPDAWRCLFPATRLSCTNWLTGCGKTAVGPASTDGAWLPL